MFSQINGKAKSQKTWRLCNQSLYKLYQVFKDDIKFKTQSRQKTQKAQEDETLVFQKNRCKMQT